MDLPHMPWISLALSHHPTVWLAPIIIISCGLTFYFFISICIVCGLVTHSHFQISLGSGGDISYMDQSSISYIFFWIRCNYMYVSGHCGPWPHTYIDYTLAINWKANICSFCLAYMVRCVQKDLPPQNLVHWLEILSLVHGLVSSRLVSPSLDHGLVWAEVGRPDRRRPARRDFPLGARLVTWPGAQPMRGKLRAEPWGGNWRGVRGGHSRGTWILTIK